MQVTSCPTTKQVTATLTLREAGKLAASLRGLSPLPAALAPLLDLLKDVPTPEATRGELRHEWGDPLDTDHDIGPA